MSARRKLSAQIHRPGKGPDEATIYVYDNDPLNYKVGHGNITSESGVLTLDLGSYNSFSTTLTENITLIDINGPMKANEHWEFNLQLTQHASSPKTVAWAAKYRFPNGIDHEMSVGVDDIDSIHGYSINVGVNWDCTFTNNSS